MKENINSILLIITITLWIGIFIGCLIMSKTKYDLLEQNEHLKIELNTYKNIVEVLKENES